MHTVRDAVEELIEESYLLTLSEEEICRELERFSSVCERVVTENVQDNGRLKHVLLRLASIRAAAPIRPFGSPNLLLRLFRKKRVTHTSKEKYVEKVAKVKRAMTKAIERFEPQLIPLIDNDLTQWSGSPLFLMRTTERVPIKGRRRVWRPVLVALFALVVVSLFLFIARKG